MQFFRISIFLLSKIPRLQNFKHSYLGNVAVCGKMDNWGSFPIVQRYLIKVAYAWHPLAKLVLVQKGQKPPKTLHTGWVLRWNPKKKLPKFFFDMLFVTAQRFQKRGQTWFSCKIKPHLALLAVFNRCGVYGTDEMGSEMSEFLNGRML